MNSNTPHLIYQVSGQSDAIKQWMQTHEELIKEHFKADHNFGIITFHNPHRPSVFSLCEFTNIQFWGR